MYYLEILKEFYENKVEYLIVGGLAVNLHGIPRLTQDIDIIITSNPENIKKIINILEKLCYVPKLPGVNAKDLMDQDKIKTWIKERNLISFNFYKPDEPYKEVDIILSHPLDFEKANEHRVIKSAESIDIYTVSIDDLIIMKKYSNRAQDKSDIALLKKLKELPKT